MSIDVVDKFDERVISFAKDMDSSNDAKNAEKIHSLIEDAKILIPQLDIISQFYLYFIIGTAYANLDSFPSFHYNEINLEKQIYNFRKSEEIFKQIPQTMDNKMLSQVNGLACQLYTNYGNSLAKCGRISSSIRVYLHAKKINPKFGMALGSIGLTYFHYASSVFNDYHYYYIHYFAYQFLNEAIKYPDTLEPEALDNYSKMISNYDPNFVETFGKHPLKYKGNNYESKEELEYRQWAINYHLFINPMSDLPIYDLYFATDILHLPNIILKIDEKSVYQGLFNQLKEEYIFARYSYYESLHTPSTNHFVDNQTFLLKFPDYSQYSLRLEKMKTSFRILYSILDKVAYFLNSYYHLGIPEKSIDFNKIWPHLKKETSDGGIVDLSKNRSLNAIYWISKDFYPDLFVSLKDESPNPNAKHLRDLRNALEHKYVIIYSDIFPKYSDGKKDDLAQYISEESLCYDTLNLMKLVREVLINLVFAVNIEDKHIRSKITGPIGEILLLSYEDEWKL